MAGRTGEQVVELAGVAVTVLPLAGLLRRLGDYAAVGGPGGGPATVGYINAHVFNLAWADASFRRVLRGCTLVWPDGVSGRWACRAAGARAGERLSAFQFYERFNRALASAGRSQFLLGGRREVVAAAAGVLAARHGGSLVAGWRDGYFGPEADEAVIEQVNASGADVLTVGMGCPRQERWLARHAGRLRPRLLWAVGALFDQLSGAERAAPRGIPGAGLEWAWRLGADPRGKWRRYLVGNPLFIWRVLRRRPPPE